MLKLNTDIVFHHYCWDTVLFLASSQMLSHYSLTLSSVLGILHDLRMLALRLLKPSARQLAATCVCVPFAAEWGRLQSSAGNSCPLPPNTTRPEHKNRKEAFGGSWAKVKQWSWQDVDTLCSHAIQCWCRNIDFSCFGEVGENDNEQLEKLEAM